MEKIIREGLKAGKIQRLKGELDYLRFKDSFMGVERGTVISGNHIIWGFPHIKRIFTLENGLKRNIKGDTVYAEEKIDGFNIRIGRINGKIFAFSRGGFLDAFVTEKTREMKVTEFFGDHEDHVLCAEMLGNTPYTRPTKDFDVKIFVFDIDVGDGSYMAPQKRYDILRKYGIESVPQLGKFKSDDYAGLGRLMQALNRGRKEGMVLKSSDRTSVVKYVTPFADIDDIEKTSGNFFDMPAGFYYQRILRSAFSINDFGFEKDDYSRKLGKAFYEGLGKSLEKARKGEEIDEEFEILIKDKKIWDDIRAHMSRSIKLEKLWEREEKGKTRIRFRKVYKKTTKKLISYAQGKGIID